MPPAPSGPAMMIAGGTGLDPVTVQVWIQCEGGPPSNPLNIGPGASPGIAGTIAEINGGSNWGGIRASRGQPPAAQLAAIKASPWDAGHYSNGCLDRVLGEPLAAAAPASSSGGGGGGGDLASQIESALLGVLGSSDTSIGQWITEHVIRGLEVIGGGIILAVGVLLLVDIAARPSGGGPGPIRSAGRAGKTLLEGIGLGALL